MIKTKQNKPLHLFKTTFSRLIAKKTDEVYIGRDVGIVFICFFKDRKHTSFSSLA